MFSRQNRVYVPWERCSEHYSQLDEGSLRDREEFSSADVRTRLAFLEEMESQSQIVYLGELNWLRDWTNDEKLTYGDWCRRHLESKFFTKGPSDDLILQSADEFTEDYWKYESSRVGDLVIYDEISKPTLRVQEVTIELPGDSNGPSRSAFVAAYEILFDLMYYLNWVATRQQATTVPEDKASSGDDDEDLLHGILIYPDCIRWDLVVCSEWGAVFEYRFNGRKYIPRD